MLFASVFIFIAGSRVLRANGRERDARKLLQILANEEIGKSTLESFDQTTEPFQHYRVQDYVGNDDPLTRRFLIRGVHDDSVIAVSAHFQNGKLSGRGAGIAVDGCTLGVDQNPLKEALSPLGNQNYVIQEHVAMYSILINVSSHDKSLSDSLILGFNAKCLSNATSCKEAESLNTKYGELVSKQVGTACATP